MATEPVTTDGLLSDSAAAEALLMLLNFAVPSNLCKEADIQLVEQPSVAMTGSTMTGSTQVLLLILYEVQLQNTSNYNGAI